LTSGADVNQTGKVDGDLPLQSAVKSDSTKCVKEIIKMYPKQLHTKVSQHSFWLQLPLFPSFTPLEKISK